MSYYRQNTHSFTFYSKHRLKRMSTVHNRDKVKVDIEAYEEINGGEHE